MNVYAVFFYDVLIAQFERATDAVDFALTYSAPNFLPLTTNNIQEDYTMTVYSYLPTDNYCKELIYNKTGIRL